jgi:probable rRNA maturation factor
MIYVESALEPQPVAVELVERAGMAALKHAAAEGGLTVVLTDDEQLQQLNRDYLGIDSPTDVLSFPAAETDPETGMPYLGDVLISVPRAESQARAAGHPLQSEVQLLVVHGVLHLLGFDHAQVEERARMWAAQDEVLTGIGLAGIRLTES